MVWLDFDRVVNYASVSSQLHSSEWSNSRSIQGSQEAIGYIVNRDGRKVPIVHEINKALAPRKQAFPILLDRVQNCMNAARMVVSKENVLLGECRKAVTVILGNSVKSVDLILTNLLVRGLEGVFDEAKILVIFEAVEVTVPRNADSSGRRVLHACTMCSGLVNGMVKARDNNMRSYMDVILQCFTPTLATATHSHPLTSSSPPRLTPISVPIICLSCTCEMSFERMSSIQCLP